MFAAQSLSLLKPFDAEPGTLLIREVGGVGGLALTTSVEDLGNQVPSYVEIIEAGEHPAILRPAVVNGGSWLAINNWQLLIDPASSYTSYQAMPAAGDAFIFAGVAGVVANFAHNAAISYVTTDGAHLVNLDWQFFAGFRRWKIVHWLERDADPVVLYERNPG